MIWEENGLLTVAGGKLTTFHEIAHDTLEILRPHFPALQHLEPHTSVFNPVDVVLPSVNGLDQSAQRRLLGRYGNAAAALVNAAQPGELVSIQGTNFLWAELRWAARTEAVIHLEDLMLRRTRLGLLLPAGGQAIMPEIRRICQPELGWNDQQWANEEDAYLNLWQEHYSLPPVEDIPDWKPLLDQARVHRQLKLQARKRRVRRLSLGTLLAGLLGLAVFITYINSRKRTQPRE
jgi:glycerol-3-phosphate dehydrogenase